jgi:hypothetical protein
MNGFFLHTSVQDVVHFLGHQSGAQQQNKKLQAMLSYLDTSEAKEYIENDNILTPRLLDVLK